MQISARMAVHNLAPERRRKPRPDAETNGTLSGFGFNGMDVLIRDISTAGFRVKSATRLPPGSLVMLRLAGFGNAIGVIRWTRRDEMGGEFVNPVSDNRINAIVGYKQLSSAAAVAA